MRKLRWGLIGGGEGSQIGPAHRLAAAIDGSFQLVAGALDADPDAGRDFGVRLGIEPELAYGDWQEMLAAERSRPDPVDLVTVATPNATHHAITKAFLEAGFHVLCEKPMTMTVDEARDIVATQQATGRLCAVNYGYSGYPLVRQMRAMVRNGDLGHIRLVVAEFAHGHHADTADAENPRARWRYDPAQAGVSAVLADAGIHALHLACFVTGQNVESVSADFVSSIASRTLEDDAHVNLRLSAGTVGRLWSSAIALGRQHGLTLQVFGERGGLRWAQEHPNQLAWTPLGGRTQTIERGEAGLSGDAERASHITLGHPEGMAMAFANIYSDLAAAIRAPQDGAGSSAYLFPTAADGAHSVAAIHTAARSARESGAWLRVEDVSR